MVDFDHRTGLAQRLILGELLHRQDRAAGNVVLVEDAHGLELILGHGPLLDAGEDRLELRQACIWRGVAGIGDPALFADHLADLVPNRRLRDEVDIGVGIVFPAFALEDPARLAAAGIVAGARYRVTERNVFAELAVFLERPMLQPLLVAQLDAAEIEHAVLHRDGDALALTRVGAVVERGDDTEREVQTVAGIADLRASDQRRALPEAGGGRRAAGALRDVLVHLAFLIGTRTEALDRRHDDLGIDLVHA